MDRKLIVTNGSSGSAAISEILGPKPTVISWDDVLHDGPVPYRDLLVDMSAVRVEYMSSWAEEFAGLSVEAIRESFRQRDDYIMRWFEFDEIVLWFDHDLYDQLQLFQVGWYLDSAVDLEVVSVSYVPYDNYLDPVNSESMMAAFENRTRLSGSTLSVLAKYWRAYCAPEPVAFSSMLDHVVDPFPNVQPAVLRMCQEFPSVETRLTRTETQVIRILAGTEGVSPVDLFLRNRTHETRPFLGDWSFWRYLADLIDDCNPLVAIEGDVSDRFRFPDGVDDTAFKAQRLVLTPLGVDVHRGDCAWERPVTWKGGTRLCDENDWRWSESQRQIVHCN